MATKKKAVRRRSPKKAATGTDAVLAAIDTILPTATTVTVKNVDIELQPPDTAAIMEVRGLQSRLSRATTPESDATHMLSLAAGCIEACIPGCGGERTMKLMIAAGGEQGELALAALHLCGFAWLTGRVDESMKEALDGPT